MKTKIIETYNYVLQVSDEDINTDDYFLIDDCFGKDYAKVIAHKPKNNAPYLDLPLLSDVDIKLLKHTKNKQP